jgi:RNA polymerase sigma-70 factor (ECF subfamily)
MESKLFLLTNNNFASLDKSLQEEVYRDFFNLVYGVSMYVIQDHSSAEDIVQEVFLKTIYNAPSFENEQQLRAWIKVVTKNLTLNVLRKNKKIRNQDDIESVMNNDLNKHNESIEKEVEVKMLEEKNYRWFVGN